MQKVLFIGLVFPESNSTAAGSRILQLITFFSEKNCEVIFASAAQKSTFSDDLRKLTVQEVAIELNNTNFDDFVSKLNPSIVVFDRFISEEQFGWRVAENCPNAIRILDTEDLHCLRVAREKAFKQQRPFEINDLIALEITKREIASLYRCDISLIISSFEMKVLINEFKIPTDILVELPFMLGEISEKEILDRPLFDDRANFISIGNFKHEPNWQSVLYLKKTIWPLIRKQLPKAQLLVYGAYPTLKVTDLHNEKEGFIVKGRAEDAHDVISTAKVLLSPLQFGAGLKGKLIDAMQCGTPSITTRIGAESMHDDLPWNGFIADYPERFAEKAVELYTNKELWQTSQRNGYDIINQVYDSVELSEKLWKRLNDVQRSLASHRANNFIGSLLQHHTLQSTKYLAKWIEVKNG